MHEIAAMRMNWLVVIAVWMGGIGSGCVTGGESPKPAPAAVAGDLPKTGQPDGTAVAADLPKTGQPDDFDTTVAADLPKTGQPDGVPDGIDVVVAADLAKTGQPDGVHVAAVTPNQPGSATSSTR